MKKQTRMLASLRHSLAIFLTIMIYGCTVPIQYPQPARGMAQLLHIRDFSGRILPGGTRLAELDGNQTFMGRAVGDFAIVEIVQGDHTLLIDVMWSNRYRDKTKMEFLAVAGRNYLVGLYELKVDENLAEVEIRMPEREIHPLSAGMAGGILYGLAPILAIVASPILFYVGIRALLAETPNDRPFEGCCFVWVQEVDTGVVVAGTSPKTIDKEKKLP